MGTSDSRWNRPQQTPNTMRTNPTTTTTLNKSPRLKRQFSAQRPLQVGLGFGTRHRPTVTRYARIAREYLQCMEYVILGLSVPAP